MACQRRTIYQGSLEATDWKSFVNSLSQSTKSSRVGWVGQCFNWTSPSFPLAILMFQPTSSHLLYSFQETSLSNISFTMCNKCTKYSKSEAPMIIIMHLRASGNLRVSSMFQFLHLHNTFGSNCSRQTCHYSHRATLKIRKWILWPSSQPFQWLPSEQKGILQ